MIMPHDDAPYLSTGSFGGWRKCRTCMRRYTRGEYVAHAVRGPVNAWHERIYAEMWEDYCKQEQTKCHK